MMADREIDPEHDFSQSERGIRGKCVERHEEGASLSRMREGWDEIEGVETRLLRQMTAQESLRHYLALQRAFEPQLQQTEPLFRAERMAYLEELQRRLAKLKDISAK